MKGRIWIVIGWCLICGTLFSCLDSTPTADKEARQAQEIALQEAWREIGLPNIVNFQELKLMKMIYELRDREDLICYAYLANEMQGTVGQYLGRCIGYGIPYATQYTNPQKVVHEGTSYGLTLPQADPNGLFMPPSAEATFLMLIDPKTGTAHPVYFEPKVIISPFPLR